MNTERRYQLLHFLKNKTQVSIKELSNEFKLNEQIIRRELRILQSKQLVHKSYGMVSLNKNRLPGHLLQLSESDTHTQQPVDETILNIAKTAAEQIYNNQVVIMSNGEIAPHIIPYLSKKAITIVSNSLIIQDIASQYSNIRLISTGGIWDDKSKSYTGFFAELMLQNIKADVMVFEPSGIDKQNGLTHDDINNISITRLIIKTARNVMVLAHDQHIFNTQSGIIVSPYNAMHIIISNKKYSKEEINYFDEYDIRYISI